MGAVRCRERLGGPRVSTVKTRDLVKLNNNSTPTRFRHAAPLDNLTAFLGVLHTHAKHRPSGLPNFDDLNAYFDMIRLEPALHYSS